MPSPRTKLLLLTLAALALPACYDRTQRGILNPDGSGKVLIETDVNVPAPADARDPDATLNAGRQLAADFINATRGVDAWADVSVTQTGPGRVHISTVAFFPDITKLRFDVPLVFGWEKKPDGACVFSIARERSAPAKPPDLTDADLKEQVALAQARYKDQELALKTALNAFKLQISYRLPGEITHFHQFTRDDQTVTIILDGTKIMPALDKFMADDKAIATAIKSGDALMSNDDLLLESMYGHKGAVEATCKLPSDGAPVFNYRLESKTAELAQADMLEAAHIQLVAKFIVKPPATTHATPPVTRPK